MSRQLLSAALFALMLCACSGEDRSGEEPFAPEVRMDSAVVDGDTLRLSAVVLSSPNSKLTACGFIVVGDTVRLTLEADTVDWRFKANTARPAPGNYGAVAQATNGMGTTTSDTLRFSVP